MLKLLRFTSAFAIAFGGALFLKAAVDSDLFAALFASVFIAYGYALLPAPGGDGQASGRVL